ncbi:MAG TPA: hypothetical protein VEB22_07670, partial [Phycisphaerales bacterium]|nr:hypothetical protein [Phycisphaerales bacterium]
MKTAIASLSVAALAGIASAQTLYTSDFNAPLYSDGALIGQDGWVITGSSVVNPINIANTGTNGNVTLATTGQDVRRPFAPQTANSVFLQFDMVMLTAAATGDYFIHLGDGGTSNFYARVYARSSGAGFQMALGTSAGAVSYGSTVLNFGQTYTVVARYDFVAGAANDTGALYIDPTTPGGTGDTPYVLATTIGTDATTIAA